MEEINIRAITWNVEATQIPSTFKCAELLGINDQNIDICIVGFQEVGSRLDRLFQDVFIDGEDPWTNSVTQELAEYDYVKVLSKRYFGAVISVFCLRKHLVYLRNMEVQYISFVEDLTLYGNTLLIGKSGALKGGVSVRFELYSKSFCFVCSHLEHNTDYDMLEKRIQHYDMVINNIRFQSNNQSLTILDHDYVIWIGDLNFRLEPKSYTHAEIVQMISTGNLLALKKVDQLLKTRNSGKAFQGFHEHEGEPKFAPTYKFKIGTNVYDKKRCPAWTDRILYKEKEAQQSDTENATSKMQSSRYESRTGENFQCSDHRPVSCDFTCFVVKKEIQIPSNQNVVKFLQSNETPVEWWTNDNTEIKLAIPYEVAQDGEQEMNGWDWIGLYHEHFTSFDDYVTFTWAVKYPQDSSIKNAFITSHYIDKGCNYVAVYHSAKSSILGLSEAFEIK